MSVNRVTQVVAGVVDVYMLRPSAGGWQVLTLQRASKARCAGAWETVHGRIEHDELPEDAAIREVLEETGLGIERLYNVTVQPFYLHHAGCVQMAVVFAGFVTTGASVKLSDEHQAYEWLPVKTALDRFIWPREVEALGHVVKLLLPAGHAGPVEDVLRVR